MSEQRNVEFLFAYLRREVVRRERADHLSRLVDGIEDVLLPCSTWVKFEPVHEDPQLRPTDLQLLDESINCLFIFLTITDESIKAKWLALLVRIGFSLTLLHPVKRFAERR